MTVLKQPRNEGYKCTVPVIGRKYKDSHGVVLRAVPPEKPGLCYGCDIYEAHDFPKCDDSGRPSCVAEQHIIWKKVK